MTSSKTKSDEKHLGVTDANDPIQQLLDDRARWPEWLQPMHVAITGVPNPGSKPRDTTPLKLLLEDVSLLAVSASLSAWSANALVVAGSVTAMVGLAPVVLVAGMAAVGRLRRLVVGHNHEAGHGVVAAFYESRGIAPAIAKLIARFIATFSTLTTFTQNNDDYAREHEDHHGRWLGTRQDPDGEQLHEWGFWPGKITSVRQHMWRTILNPIWHARFLIKRLESNLLRGPAYRRLLAAMRLALGIAALALMPWPSALALLAIWVPGYQTASLVQLLTIHTYGHTKPADTLEDYAERTHERIPYRLMPKSGGVREWLSWGWSMLGHIAARLTVLDDTMIAHGWHHLAWPTGNSFNDWWNTSLGMVNAYFEGKLPPGKEQRIQMGIGPALDRHQKVLDQLASKG